MRIIGCDLHARQQTLAMLDTATGEVVNETLAHEGDHVREFYSRLPSLLIPSSFLDLRLVRDREAQV
jgi:hypothetical protein